MKAAIKEGVKKEKTNIAAIESQTKEAGRISKNLYTARIKTERASFRQQRRCRLLL